MVIFDGVALLLVGKCAVFVGLLLQELGIFRFQIIQVGIAVQARLRDLLVKLCEAPQPFLLVLVLALAICCGLCDLGAVGIAAVVKPLRGKFVCKLLFAGYITLIVLPGEGVILLVIERPVVFDLLDIRFHALAGGVLCGLLRLLEIVRLLSGLGVILRLLLGEPLLVIDAAGRRHDPRLRPCGVGDDGAVVNPLRPCCIFIHLVVDGEADGLLAGRVCVVHADGGGRGLTVQLCGLLHVAGLDVADVIDLTPGIGVIEGAFQKIWHWFILRLDSRS